MGGKGEKGLTEQEYICRAEALKGKLYRTAALMLGGESAAVDAVDEAFYKGFRAYKAAPAGIFRYLAHPHPHQRVQYGAAAAEAGAGRGGTARDRPGGV